MMTRKKKKAGRGYTREDWIGYHQKIVESAKQKGAKKGEEKIEKLAEFLSNRQKNSESTEDNMDPEQYENLEKVSGTLSKYTRQATKKETVRKKDSFVGKTVLAEVRIQKESKSKDVYILPQGTTDPTGTSKGQNRTDQLENVREITAVEDECSAANKTNTKEIVLVELKTNETAQVWKNTPRVERTQSEAQMEVECIGVKDTMGIKTSMEVEIDNIRRTMENLPETRVVKQEMISEALGLSQETRSKEEVENKQAVTEHKIEKDKKPYQVQEKDNHIETNQTKIQVEVKGQPNVSVSPVSKRKSEMVHSNETQKRIHLDGDILLEANPMGSNLPQEMQEKSQDLVRQETDIPIAHDSYMEDENMEDIDGQIKQSANQRSSLVS